MKTKVEKKENRNKKLEEKENTKYRGISCTSVTEINVTKIKSDHVQHIVDREKTSCTKENFIE
jgi:hypothetical protein